MATVIDQLHYELAQAKARVVLLEQEIIEQRRKYERQCEDIREVVRIERVMREKVETELRGLRDKWAQVARLVPVARTNLEGSESPFYAGVQAVNQLSELIAGEGNGSRSQDYQLSCGAQSTTRAQAVVGQNERSVLSDIEANRRPENSVGDAGHEGYTEATPCNVERTVTGRTGMGHIPREPAELQSKGPHL